MELCVKVSTMVSQSTNFDFERKLEKDIMWYYDDDFLKGKKLATAIRRSVEWKDFYNAYKKFKNDEVDGSIIDAQLVNFMRQFIIISKDFVEDVQS